MSKKRTPFSGLMCQLTGKKPVGRPRCGWVENIKRDVRVLGLEMDLETDRIL